jgi:hypothetical protein
MSMLVAVINFCIILLVLGLCFAVVIWVLGIIGVPVPMNVMKILGAIVFLIVLLWFLKALLGGGHFPSILTLPVHLLVP